MRLCIVPPQAGLIMLVATAAASAAADGPAPASPADATASTADGLREADTILAGDSTAADTLDRALALYGAALESASSTKQKAFLHARMAECWFHKGTFAPNEKSRLAAYKEGQREAEAGLALNAKCTPCRFWRTSNLGRWGETRGVLKSLFLLEELKSEYRVVLDADPKHADAVLALAIIDARVPGFAGGDSTRAIAGFREVLKLQPSHSRAMVELAVALQDEGELVEARKLLVTVSKLKRPFDRRGWLHEDKPKAKQLLKDWE